MRHARAHAKINLGLVVGPLRADGKHEIVTVLQRVDLHDDVTLEPAERLVVGGFAEDTIVRTALTHLARAAGDDPLWRVRIEKRIPIAAGLGGGSADAAAALSLANELLPRPLDDAALHRVAADIGADVPFFLTSGAQLGTGVGTELAPVALPTDYHVVLLVPREETKRSTASVYESFDARDGAQGFDRRAGDFRSSLSSVATTRDLATLPANDLASSRFEGRWREAGAFRADVTGAGPAVYGMFERADEARRASAALEGDGDTVVTRPI
jgi:4-diphosphocytidyl-2-C-methyl-D-erythritol kinase